MTIMIPGIHHVTAIAGDPQRNLDFYAGVIGLRLVTLTVNYDDPHTYHLYFGDDEGSPGTILTFFPWPGAPRGRPGTGQATVTSFSVPDGALGFWTERLKSRGIPFDGPASRFDEEFVRFGDPDGLALELVAHAKGETGETRDHGPVPAGFAVRGFFGVTLSEEGYERTSALLTGTLGFRVAAETGNRFRYEAEAIGAGAVVDVLCLPYGQRGHVAAGTVHHVAWRTPSAREPGGVLFEIATDPPGFSVDEPADRLGSRLMLPARLESRRPELEKVLPPLRLPERQGR